MVDSAPPTDPGSGQPPPSRREKRAHVGRRVAITLVIWMAIIAAVAAVDSEYRALVAILMFLFTAPVFIVIVAAIIPSKPRNEEPRL